MLHCLETLIGPKVRVLCTLMNWGPVGAAIDLNCPRDRVEVGGNCRVTGRVVAMVIKRVTGLLSDLQ